MLTDVSTEIRQGLVTGIGLMLSAAAAAPAQTTNYVSVAAGAFHTCALTSTGSALCWGSNDQGQLGATTTQVSANGWASSDVPLAVSGGFRFLSLALGDAHSCGITITYEMRCWGSNASGQLAARYPDPSTSPVRVVDPRRLTLSFRSLAAGTTWTCAVPVDSIGRYAPTECWGKGSPNGRTDVAPVASTLPLRVVHGGRGLQVCATDSSNVANRANFFNSYCWGTLIPGLSATLSTTPLTTRRNAHAIASGIRDVCSLTRTTLTSGPFACWGASRFSMDATTPRDFTTLAAGREHFCATTVAGGVWCWGTSQDGALGLGSSGPTRADIPRAVATGGNAFRSVAAGEQHTCGVTSAGTLYCWGANSHGQLGNGSRVNTMAPTITK